MLCTCTGTGYINKIKWKFGTCITWAWVSLLSKVYVSVYQIKRNTFVFCLPPLAYNLDSCFVFSRSGIWTWWGIALWLCVLSRCQRDPSLMATTSSDTSCSAKIKRHRSKNRERFGFDCSTLPTWPKYNHRPLECFLVLLWLVESCMWALITMRLLFNITSSLHSK